MSESTLTGRPVAAEAERTGPRYGGLSQLGSLLAARSMVPVWLTLILLLAALFRFIGLDWGANTHRHPDERHLTMVVERVQWPSSFSEYLDEANSPLNPRNNEFAWFYGDFAITLVKGAARLLNHVAPDQAPWDSYGAGYKVGRGLSALFDLGTLLVLFLSARRLYDDHRVALLAALLFSATVLAIQHAHFWVVDNFVTFFVTLTLYWLVHIFREEEGPGPVALYALAGISFGAAMAIKASVFTLASVFAVVGAYRLWLGWRRAPQGATALAEQLVLRLGLAALLAFFAFRVLQPYAFTGPGLLDIRLSERWLHNMDEVRAQVSGEADPPWGYQWANRAPILFPLKNMVLWGMGLPLGLAAWAAWGAAFWQLLRRQRWLHLIPVVWVAVLFLHQGTQWVKSMRYFLPIYPMLVMLAAWLLVRLWERAQRSQLGARAGGLFVWTPTKAAGLAGLVVGGTLLYALAFTSIYRLPHTHLQATQWLYDNVPSGTVVATEHYDEGLPLGNHTLSNPEGKTYRGLSVRDPAGNVINHDGQLNWYHEDNPQKLEEALNWLDEAEYIVTVSNRLYGSTARLPARFPMTGNYYQALFSGELGYERVADFTSGPQLFGIELDDQYSGNPTGWLGLPWDDWLAAEEAFTVYDHQRVQIFRKTVAYDREQARAILTEGVDWNNISRLTAKQWTDSGGQAVTLKFTPAERAIYEQSGSWARLFDRGSLQNRVPLLAWVLLVQLVGLLGLPYARAVGRGLPERGYALAKPLGLLLVGWLVWILASLRLMTFSVASITFAMLLVALGGAALLGAEARRQGGREPNAFERSSVRAFQRFHTLRAALFGERRLMLLAESVFWLAFGVVLLIRWANPDLWHQDMGGERPMDFAYLNAVIKSPYFPPMDPWFAGGYINYYYFGFVLVATLVKFIGIVPAVAYNLVVPTLFAMLALGVWSAALALLEPLRERWSVGTLERCNAETLQQDEGEPDLTPSPPHPLTPPHPHTPGRRSLLFAAFAVLLVCVLGNLGELKVLSETLPQLSSITFQSGIPGLATGVKMVDGFFRGVILNGQTLPGRMEWPYWNATRVIPSAPINEFPWFTFLYADLHAHMMALPFTALAIGLALAVLRAPLGEGRLAEGLRLGLLALVLGSLWPMNTWDFPTYAIVAFAGLGLREWRRDGRITARAFGAVAWRWALLLVLGRLLFQPFHAAYGVAYSSIERWTGERTGLSDFLLIHGLFLFAIFFALVNDFLFGYGHNALVRVARVRLRHLGRRRRATHLYRALVRRGALQPADLYTVAAVLIGGLLLLMILGWGVPALSLGLLLFALALFFRARVKPLWQMALFLVMLGLGLTAVVEIVVLRGDVGRMNTVFKFYLQVWVLWGIAAAIGTAQIVRRLRFWLPEWRAIWGVGLATLCGVAALYPLFATHAKINDRFDRSVGPTLDGAAFMETAIYHDQDRVRNVPVQIPLRWDAAAIRWMQETVPGSPTLAEINTAPDRVYGWGNRFAMWTGNPAIIGWDNHQRQQRAATQSGEVDERVRNVRENIYNTPDAQLAHDTLLRYGADYLIVGPLERAYTRDEGLAKFEAARGRLWDLVYENPEVKIYRVIASSGG